MMEDAYRGGSGPDRYRRGGRDARSIGPYDRPGPRSSRDPQPRRLDDALDGDELLSAEAFVRLSENAPSSPEASSYVAYVRKHRRAALERYFARHKAEAWFTEQYDPFRTELYTSKIKDQAAQRMQQFKDALEGGRYEALALDDGDDLHVEGEKPAGADGIRSFPASMKLPDRLQECLSRPPRGNVIALSNISPQVSVAELETLLRESFGDKFTHLELSHPIKDKGNYRLGWAVFDESADLGPILTTIEEKILHGDKIYCSAHRSFSLQIKEVHASFSSAARMDKDLEQVKTLVAILNSQMSLDGSFLDALAVDRSTKQLVDLLVVFLRKVHFVCYYSGVVANSATDLARQAGDICVRIRDSSSPSSFDFDIFDNAFAEVVEKLSATYEPFSEDSLLEKHVAKVDEGRYRCVHCSKLFKGPEFVVKHLRLKHEDITKTVILETAMLNAFLLRPLYPALISVSARRRSIGASIDRPLRDSGHRYDRNSHHHHHHQYPHAHSHYGRDSGRARRGPPPPPPRDAVQDPRRMRQYVDWDAPATGDVEISYD